MDCDNIHTLDIVTCFVCHYGREDLEYKIDSFCLYFLFVLLTKLY